MHISRVDEWIDIADKILTTLETAKEELEHHVAQLDTCEQREILKETIAHLLQNEELDGRIHSGPTQG